MRSEYLLVILQLLGTSRRVVRRAFFAQFFLRTHVRSKVRTSSLARTPPLYIASQFVSRASFYSFLCRDSTASSSLRGVVRSKAENISIANNAIEDYTLAKTSGQAHDQRQLISANAIQIKIKWVRSLFHYDTTKPATQLRNAIVIIYLLCIRTRKR